MNAGGATVAAGPAGRARRRSELSDLGWPLLGLLLLEFLLGMAVNLYTPLPSGSPAEVLAGQPLLWLHIVVGVLLVGITSQAVVVSLRGRVPGARVFASVGLASALIAFIAGMAFTFGGQDPAASYVMSVGFAGLFVSAGGLLWAGRPAGLGVAAPVDGSGGHGP